MGYYSFYKIIKDIIRTIFGSKFFKYLIIIIILLILLFLTSNNSYGAYEVSTHGVVFNISDNFISNNPYYVILVSDNPIYNNYYSRVIRSNSPITVNTSNNSSNYYYYYNNNNDGITSYYGTLSSTASHFNNNDFASIPSTGNEIGFSTESSTFSIIFANHNIINTYDNSVIYNSSIFTYPYFTPSATDIQDLNFENLFVELGDYNLSENKLYLHALEITNSVPENDEVLYYYSDNVFNLDSKSIYYKQFLDTTNYYFSIPKSSINFGVDKSYLLVLTDKKFLEMNSIGLYEKNETEGFFDVVLVDTSGIVTESEVINNNLNNINNNMNPNSPINNQLESSTDESIDTNLNFNNQNSTLNNLNNGFFTRLTSLLNNMIDYDSNVDTVVSIPYPNSNKTLDLHSNMISSNLSNVLQLLISAFWFYVFGFYMFKFINKIYIAVTSGSILDTFSNNDEAITNNML